MGLGASVLTGVFAAVLGGEVTRGLVAGLAAVLVTVFAMGLATGLTDVLTAGFGDCFDNWACG